MHDCVQPPFSIANCALLRFWDYQGTPGNEYDCDCNAQWMWKFLNSSAIATSVTCTSPAKYAGRLLASLEYEELVCGSGF